MAIWDRIYPSFAGSSSSFFDAAESLTDCDGRFVIPRHRAINFPPFPFTRIASPDFEIFKPGYSTDYTSDSPVRLVDGRTRAEIFRRGVVVELRKLKTREEIWKNEPSWPVEARAKLPIFCRLIDEERRNLGLEPLGALGGSRR